MKNEKLKMKKGIGICLFSLAFLVCCLAAYGQYGRGAYGRAGSGGVAPVSLWSKAANRDMVRVNAYDDTASTTGARNGGDNGGNVAVTALVWGDVTSEYFINSHRYTIRQDGTIYSIRMCIGDLSAVTEVYVDLWRPHADSQTYLYDRVARTENLLATLTASGEHTCPTIDVTDIPGIQVGDHYSVYVVTSNTPDGKYALYNTTPAYAMGANTSFPFDSLGSVMITGQAAATNFQWTTSDGNNDAVHTNTKLVTAVEFNMQAPVFVFWGDSKMSANGVSAGFADKAYAARTNAIFSQKYSIPFHVAENLRNPYSGLLPTYQNLGIGGDKSDQLLARFGQVKSAHPRVCITNIGCNDLVEGYSYTTMVTNLGKIADSCLAYGIFPVFLRELPGPYTYALQLRRDSVNTALDSIVAGSGGVYKGIACNASGEVGVDSLGVNTAAKQGNKWRSNLALGYTLAANSYHFSPLGYSKIAKVVSDAIFGAIKVSGTTMTFTANAVAYDTLTVTLGSGGVGRRFLFDAWVDSLAPTTNQGGITVEDFKTERNKYLVWPLLDTLRQSDIILDAHYWMKWGGAAANDVTFYVGTVPSAGIEGTIATVPGTWQSGSCCWNDRGFGTDPMGHVIATADSLWGGAGKPYVPWNVATAPSFTVVHGVTAWYSADVTLAVDSTLHFGRGGISFNPPATMAATRPDPYMCEYTGTTSDPYMVVKFARKR